jgi:hypothetical protein
MVTAPIARCTAKALSRLSTTVVMSRFVRKCSHG